MIEAEQSVTIAADIDAVWVYVERIEQWANLFPGCQQCELVNRDDSRWTLKVGAGGLVKTVRVLVHVEDWSGPRSVAFSFRLETEPVVGSGTYTALRESDDSTQVTMAVRVEGSGSMAAMWEAVSKPLLPQLAKTFATRLKAEIESGDAAGDVAVPAGWRSLLARAGQWLKKLWRRGSGKLSGQEYRQ